MKKNKHKWEKDNIFYPDIRETFLDFAELGIKEELQLWVWVKMPNLKEPELIINPTVNIEEKIKYYSNAYDEHMCLKSFREIEIIKAELM